MALTTDQEEIRQKAIERKKSLEEVSKETFGASSKVYQRWTGGVVPYMIHSNLGMENFICFIVNIADYELMLTRQ